MRNIEPREIEWICEMREPLAAYGTRITCEQRAEKIKKNAALWCQRGVVLFGEDRGDIANSTSSLVA